MEPTVEIAPETVPDDFLNTSFASSQSEVTDALQSKVRTIRAMKSDQLVEFCREFIPRDRMPPSEYIDSLAPSERVDALLACALVWTLSGGAEVPREFQLKAGLAAVSGHDSVIRAGTGAGKTLAMAIPMLLRPNAMAMVISPLKRLQSSQVRVFQRYGITTLEINEDTPNDESIWKGILKATWQALIVTVEQLSLHKGHLPRLARLLRQDRLFTSNFKFINVDEAHFIYTCGIRKHGQPPFRPAYGVLDVLRLLFSKQTAVSAHSATLPPHMLKVITSKLSMPTNYQSIDVSSNRPNVVYATHKLVGSTTNYNNLNCIIPIPYHPPMLIPKGVIFFDDKTESSDASAHLNLRLPQELRDAGIIKHYHGGMSKQYLQETYDDFCDPNGTCRVLCTTSAASTGIDFRFIYFVIQYGICAILAELIQRGGRAGRDETITALFLIMYEGWVEDLDVMNVEPEELEDDPDRPFLTGSKKNLTKRERVGVGMINCIQSIVCLRQIYADYLGDKTPEAYNYSRRWCCDRHEDDFDVTTFFLGPMYTGNEPKVKEPRAKYLRNRPVVDRIPLRNLLRQFRLAAHNADTLRNIRPASFILDNSGITVLAKTHPNRMKTPAQVVEVLAETSEWAAEWSQAVFDIIHGYDNPKINAIADGHDLVVSESLVEPCIESDATADTHAQPKRRTAEALVASVKRRRKDHSDDVEDTSNLRRSSRPTVPSRKYIGL